jgi:hypothetical protein
MTQAITIYPEVIDKGEQVYEIHEIKQGIITFVRKKGV